MADYYSLIDGAVSRLPSQTDEARHEIYERARMAFREILHGVDPPISAAELGNEEVRLEAAISRVESELLFSIMQRFASEKPTRSTLISSLISSTVKEFVRSAGEKLDGNIRIMRDGPRSSEATKVVPTKADITARLAQALEFGRKTQLKAMDSARRMYLSVCRYKSPGIWVRLRQFTAELAAAMTVIIAQFKPPQSK